jgi:multimeric flavodoxin WrbA
MEISVLGNVAAGAGPARQRGRGMNIVAIMGSPKGRGSGYRLVRMIEDRMKAIGDVEFAYLFLKDANLKPCLGCYTCMALGEDRCPLKDDRAAIEQELLAADGVILSSPVHVANVSGLMKNFMDRFAYTNHRPRFHRQKVLTVVNMAGTSKKETLSALRWAMGGSRFVHELAIETPPWPQTERAVADKERAIDAAARKFYRACQDTSLRAPTFKSYTNFLGMQKLALACRRQLPADHAFFGGKAYYYETKMNPVKAAVAKAIVGVVMKVFLKKMGPGNVPWPAARKADAALDSEKESAVAGATMSRRG